MPPASTDEGPRPARITPSPSEPGWAGVDFRSPEVRKKAGTSGRQWNRLGAKALGIAAGSPEVAGISVIAPLHARRPCAAVGSPPLGVLSKRPRTDLAPQRAQTLRRSWEPPCSRPGEGTHPRAPSRLQVNARRLPCLPTPNVWLRAALCVGQVPSRAARAASHCPLTAASLCPLPDHRPSGLHETNRNGHDTTAG